MYRKKKEAIVQNRDPAKTYKDIRNGMVVFEYFSLFILRTSSSFFDWKHESRNYNWFEFHFLKTVANNKLFILKK